MSPNSPASHAPALASILSSKKAFLWDFDGCFADTERLHYLAYREAFAQYGHELREEGYYASFTHLGDGTGREIARSGLDVPVDVLLEAKKKAYWRIINEDPVALFPETRAIVEALARSGAKIAIASNSPAEEIEVILRRAGFDGPLDLLVGRGPGLRKKPHPDLFQRAMELLAIAPGQALVFEDSERGLAAARAAGCAAVWIRTAFNEDLVTGEPHVAAVRHGTLLDAATQSANWLG